MKEGTAAELLNKAESRSSEQKTELTSHSHQAADGVVASYTLEGHLWALVVSRFKGRPADPSPASYTTQGNIEVS